MRKIVIFTYKMFVGNIIICYVIFRLVMLWMVIYICFYNNGCRGKKIMRIRINLDL